MFKVLKDTYYLNICSNIKSKNVSILDIYFNVMLTSVRQLLMIVQLIIK